MTFSFVLPAAASATPPVNPGASVGVAGQAGAAGDPLGLFGQLLTMLGIDPQTAGDLTTKIAGDLDPKSLARTLGKAAGKAGDADQGDDKSKDAIKDDTSAAPIDLSALIAALLAAAQQTIPVATSSAAGAEAAPADQALAGVSADGGAPTPQVQTQLETLMAALAGEAQPKTPDGKPTTPQAAAQAATTLAKPELALAAPRIDAEAQSAAPPPAPAIVEPVQPQAPAAEAAAAIAQPNAAVQSQVAVSDPKIAAAPARQAPPTKSVSPASGARTQAEANGAPSQGAAAAAPAQPAPDIPKASTFKPDPDLAALAGDLAAKPGEKRSDDEIPTGPAAGAPAQALAADAAAPLAAQIAVRGSPETVAKLAAQIVKKLDSRTTRFDVALDPIGLGRVDVKVEIGANGKLHAQMSFDSAAAASDLRGRAGQLREALEQAGFDLKGGSLNFDVAGQGGQGRGQQQQQGDHPRFTGPGGMFEAALSLGDTPIPAPVWAKSGAASGVDIRI
ncbi:MAG: flagellar hook length determination-like protein [Caulobacteraceae bacterium]|nr:flagellar hook length determination-like protein [Caulobacteraceae bacterium]